MKNAELCVTCVHEKKCIFSSRTPVLQCEEFDLGVIQCKTAAFQPIRKAASKGKVLSADDSLQE